jgi:hypothetical protein
MIVVLFVPGVRDTERDDSLHEVRATASRGG